ncbi:DUF397 domain-containing protein [Streptomyces chrestomyceticus]|uniref:DUF397 domain-containing protein n=1 Tax=Streptomyces chrestomyceticus TaxID=68185 RepID=UPI0027DC4427|nr:DUF397 domain-containing protein [Streptomyces chrestomyceticus]
MSSTPRRSTSARRHESRQRCAACADHETRPTWNNSQERGLITINAHTGNGCRYGQWFKSLYSSEGGTECVEACPQPGRVHIRDSKRNAARTSPSPLAARAAFIQQTAGRHNGGQEPVAQRQDASGREESRHRAADLLQLSNAVAPLQQPPELRMEGEPPPRRSACRSPAAEARRDPQVSGQRARTPAGPTPDQTKQDPLMPWADDRWRVWQPGGRAVSHRASLAADPARLLAVTQAGARPGRRRSPCGCLWRTVD